MIGVERDDTLFSVPTFVVGAEGEIDFGEARMGRERGASNDYTVRVSNLVERLQGEPVVVYVPNASVYSSHFPVGDEPELQLIVESSAGPVEADDTVVVIQRKSSDQALAATVIERAYLGPAVNPSMGSVGEYALTTPAGSTTVRLQIDGRPACRFDRCTVTVIVRGRVHSTSLGGSPALVLATASSSELVFDEEMVFPALDLEQVHLELYVHGPFDDRLREIPAPYRRRIPLDGDSEVTLTADAARPRNLKVNGVLLGDAIPTMSADTLRIEWDPPSGSVTGYQVVSRIADGPAAQFFTRDPHLEVPSRFVEAGLVILKIFALTDDGWSLSAPSLGSENFLETQLMGALELL